MTTPDAGERLARPALRRDDGRTKLSPEDVEVIRCRRFVRGESYAVIGRDYGVNQATIGRVCRRELWNHLGEDRYDVIAREQSAQRQSDLAIHDGRRCAKCLEIKPASEFNSSPRARLHLHAYCKLCSALYEKNRRERGGEKIRATERQQARVRYAKDPESYLERHRRWMIENPEKVAAETILRSAVRKGTIQRPAFCEKCGVQERRIDGHHDDYSKPLEVRWLCTVCHKRADRERAEAERRAASEEEA